MTRKAILFMLVSLTVSVGAAAAKETTSDGALLPPGEHYLVLVDDLVKMGGGQILCERRFLWNPATKVLTVFVDVPIPGHLQAKRDGIALSKFTIQADRREVVPTIEFEGEEAILRMTPGTELQLSGCMTAEER